MAITISTLSYDMVRAWAAETPVVQTQEASPLAQLLAKPAKLGKSPGEAPQGAFAMMAMIQRGQFVVCGTCGRPECSWSHWVTQ